MKRFRLDAVDGGVPDGSADAEEPSEEDDSNHYLFRRALDLIQSSFEETTWRAFWRVVVDGKSPQETGEEWV